MPKQMTFASLARATKKKVTRREKFLAEMETVVPWSHLLVLIEPHYSKMGSKGRRPAIPLAVMLRIYCLQQWYALSDPMAEESLYDSDAMRRFTGLELGDDRIPPFGDCCAFTCRAVEGGNKPIAMRRSKPA